MPGVWGTVLTWLLAAGAAYVGARVSWRVLGFPFRQPGLPRWLAGLIAALHMAAGVFVSLYLTFFLIPLVAAPFLLLRLRSPDDLTPLTGLEAVPVATYLIGVFLSLGLWLTGWVQRPLTRLLGRLLLRLRHKRVSAATPPTDGEPL